MSRLASQETKHNLKQLRVSTTICILGPPSRRIRVLCSLCVYVCSLLSSSRIKMPRPGPRPYECVRRSWHSDRHQPMRGSLIQEIFRVANEIHCSATKKNKEWQEKLPIVVLKAEEIMYSKANSEREYMDLKTLRDRANDAINMIIRRDESTETGAFLQPCIEAALNLGCTPRRALRSQRNDTLSYCLGAISPGPICVPSSSLQNTTQGNQTTNSLVMSHYPNFMKPATMNSSYFGPESHSPVFQNKNCTANKSSIAPENYPPSSSSDLCKNNCHSSSSSSVYPLYNGDHFQSEGSNVGFGTPSMSNSHSIEAGEVGFEQNLSICNTDASNKISQADFQNTPENRPGIGCDLSLRLCPLVVPCISFENSWPQEVEDVGSSTSREGSKLSDMSPQMDKDFSFFPKAMADNPLDFCSSKWSFESENLNAEATLRKRKAVASHLAEDRQPKLPSNHFTGRMRNSGS